jgi:hypothetical protein
MGPVHVSREWASTRMDTGSMMFLNLTSGLCVSLRAFCASDLCALLWAYWPCFWPSDWRPCGPRALLPSGLLNSCCGVSGLCDLFFWISREFECLSFSVYLLVLTCFASVFVWNGELLALALSLRRYLFMRVDKFPLVCWHCSLLRGGGETGLWKLSLLGTTSWSNLSLANFLWVIHGALQFNWRYPNCFKRLLILLSYIFFSMGSKEMAINVHSFILKHGEQQICILIPVSAKWGAVDSSLWLAVSCILWVAVVIFVIFPVYVFSSP